MTLRSYSNLIILETVLDSIPEVNPTVNQLSAAVFTPRVPVTEHDCGTTLGRLTEVNYDIAGKVELSTGNIIGVTRIKELLSRGIYEIPVRSLDTCIADGGVCQACYHASRQRLLIPDLGDTALIEPEFIKAVDYFPTEPGNISFNLSQSPDLYDHAYVYFEDYLVNPNQYTISGQVLTFNTSITIQDQVTVKYAVHTKSPFLSWLSDTYSGSLLGLKSLPHPPLPIRRSLYTSLIPGSMVELLSEESSTMPGVPIDVINSYGLIRCALEKALLVLAIYGVYLNIQQ